MRDPAESRAATYALFHGLLLAAVLLGAVEAAQLAISGELARGERWAAAIYVLAPYALFGLLVAATAAGLAGLWTRARRIGSTTRRLTPRERPAPARAATTPTAELPALPAPAGDDPQADDRAEGTTPIEAYPVLDAPPPSRSADAGAGLLAVVLFAGLIYGPTRLILAYTHNRAVGAAALAGWTPVAAIGALYFWAVARIRLAHLDRRWAWGSRIMTGLLAAIGLSAIGLTVARNDALRERLGGWTAAFIVAYPLLTIALTTALRRVSARRLGGPAVRRAVLALGIVSALGAADLVVHIDARGTIKKALLHQTLVFQPLVIVAQPLFDADGDGYAGLLGGGDCDDDNPDVHPGAREIPRNSIDDDCFGGDSPGKPQPKLPAPEPPPAEPGAVGAPLASRPHIVLITVDTLRADRLGYAGYARDSTPNLDQLAHSGLRFTWAFSQGPQTKASMPSMFIGRYYSEVDRSPDLWATVHPENVTLAERLQAAGYHTAGIPSHRFFLPGYGLDQGFTEWDLSIVRRYQKRIPHVISGNLVTDAALKWLAGRPEDPPFFLWLHYIDPHHFYQDHEDIDYGTEPEDLYDEEIRYTDRQIGRLLRWLDASPFAEDTYVIVQSDHGEGFYEHGYRYHGQHLYNDQVRVPLIIAGPGLPSRQIDQPVAMIDIVPTVLELVGLDIPSDLQGVSLVPYGTRATPPKHPPVFVEMVKDATHSDRRAIIDWPWKLHYGITFDEYQLYDLSRDPHEQEELSERHPEVFERLQNRLRQWMSEEVEPARPRR